MAYTWPPRKWKVALVGTIDSIGRPVARLVRIGAPRPPVAEPREILVVELWQIGDVVLATPFLAALRKCFPRARITLLGKHHAAELLEHSGLVDEVVVADLPWTRPSAKYDPSAYDRRSLSRLLRRLRDRRFDVAFDARMDIRSNLLVARTGARRRIGFRYGGGDWLLTDAMPVDPRRNHKVDDWLSLLDAVGCADRGDRQCVLRTSEEEKAVAREAIGDSTALGGPIIGIHPGGSHAGKRWPLANFVELARQLRAAGHRALAFEDRQGLGRALSSVEGVMVIKPTLRQMMATIEQCSVLVCNDSGPMHVAAALGTPTVAIFETGEPRWYGPVGERHIVIAGALAGVEVFAAPGRSAPVNPVPVPRVFDAVLAQLRRLGDADGA